MLRNDVDQIRTTNLQFLGLSLPVHYLPVPPASYLFDHLEGIKCFNGAIILNLVGDCWLSPDAISRSSYELCVWVSNEGMWVGILGVINSLHGPEITGLQTLGVQSTWRWLVVRNNQGSLVLSFDSLIYPSHSPYNVYCISCPLHVPAVRPILPWDLMM